MLFAYNTERVIESRELSTNEQTDIASPMCIQYMQRMHKRKTKYVDIKYSQKYT